MLLTRLKIKIVATFILICLPSVSTNIAAEPAVQPSSYEAPSQPVDKAQVIRFSQQPTELHSRVTQQVGVDLEINSTITQSGQIANQSSAKISSRQQRVIEALEVIDGRVRRAQVSFPYSRSLAPENPDPSKEETQVVEGKSYLVTRDGQQLFITDSEGAIPPIAEYEIVLGSVQTLGLPNPLAKYLTNRTIRIGDRLQLPQEVANRLLGFTEQLGQVQQFEIELKEIREIDNRRCALFAATIKIVDTADGPTKINAQGQVAIEINSCRTVAARLSGPLKMKAFQASYQYVAEGGLQVAIQSRYDTASK